MTMQLGCRWSALAFKALPVAFAVCLTPTFVGCGTAPAGMDAPGMSPASALPKGVHVANDGHYHQEVCNHSAVSYCLAERLVPEGVRSQASALSVQTAQPAAAAAPAFGGDFCAGQEGGLGEALPPPGAMAPSDVLAAYDIAPWTMAEGRIVALVDMPDSTAFEDLNAYRQAFGIPALPRCPGGVPDGHVPCFAAVDEDGAPTDTQLDCPAADGETSLDMDMVSAACPDCSILLVQMTAAKQGPFPQDFVTASATAAKLGAVATSISFGGPEEGGEPIGFTTPGHLVVAASGDTGYLLEGSYGGGRSPSYPASAPDVLAVGGTILERKGATYSEVVWADRTGSTSSGCSTEFAMPDYQKRFGAGHFGKCGKRASVDVAAASNFAPGTGGGGIATYESRNQWVPMVGTSAAAPLVAAILTRVGVAAATSNDLGLVYANMGAFNDVTSGSDDQQGLCPAADVMCTAGPGWDGPTGVGSPNGAKLAALAR
jgi:subtilase family serine protease